VGKRKGDLDVLRLTADNDTLRHMLGASLGAFGAYIQITPDLHCSVCAIRLLDGATTLESADRTKNIYVS
jgi:hypothetical protein